VTPATDEQGSQSDQEPTLEQAPPPAGSPEPQRRELSSGALEAPAEDALVKGIVEIANAPAAAELVDPGEFLSGRINLIARAPDRLSTQMIFEAAVVGSEDWRALGTARAPFHLPVDTRRLVDGVYELRVESLSAGGQSTYSRSHGPHIVDNTPPTVEIVQPLEGSELRGWVEFVANAGDDTSGLARVALSYTEGGEWRPLAELEPEGGEVRGFWQTEDCQPSHCQLRATAYDRAGNEASHIIAVTIVATPPASKPEPEQAATPEPKPGPERSSPPAARPPSSQAVARFGSVPSWKWERPEETEEVVVAPEERPEPGPEPAVTAKKPAKTSVAWRWKAPESEPEQAPESEEEREPEKKPAPVAEKESEPEEAPELEQEEPPALEETPKPEEEPKPEPEEALESAEKPEPEQEGGHVPEEPRQAIGLVEPLHGEDPANAEKESPEGGSEEVEDEEKPEKTGSAPSQGGRLVGFPRAARGWDIWALSALVEGTPDQDPAREEERRQILYYLREYVAVDGRIPPEFEDLVLEAFGDLIRDDPGR
jgi:hypothetical protein